MGNMAVVETTNYTPKKVASDLIGTIKDIEESIESSASSIKEIQGRGFFKTMFSSSSKDLVNISQSQNKINELMLGVIQEIITLNVMSYSYLAGVLVEFEKMSKDGWQDNEGRLQTLSDNGRNFANTASEIFKKIMEGSKATQQKIQLNGERIEQLRLYLSQKDELDEQQSEDIFALKEALREKGELDSLQSQHLSQLTQSLGEKKLLDDQQSKEIAKIITVLDDKGAVDTEQSQQLEKLTMALDEKNRIDSEQSTHLEEMRQILEDQKTIGGQHSQKLIQLFQNLQQNKKKGKTRDTAIAALSKNMEGVKQNIQKLEARSKLLLSFGIGQGIVIAGILIRLLTTSF